MTEKVKKTNLVGDLKYAGDEGVVPEFLEKLQALMFEYKIDKIDMCWGFFGSLVEGEVDEDE